MTDQELGQEAGPVTEFTHDPGDTSTGREVPTSEQDLSAAERDAEQDNALSNLLESLDVVGADGGQAAILQDEPGSEGTPPAVSDAAPAEAAPDTQETPAAPDDERRLAEAIIRRDGEWTAEDLAGLSKERVLAISAQREKVQGDMDRHMAELVELRKSGDTPPGERTGSKNDAEAVSTPKVDITALAETLALDSDGAQVLANAMQQQVAPLLQELGVLKEGNQSTEKMVKSVMAEFARRDLSERFPQVQDASSENYSKVLTMMNTLQRGGDQTPTAQLMEDAILITFKDEIKASASEATSLLRTARANGQPVTSTTDRVSKHSDPTKMTQDERESSVLELLDKGGAHDHAQRVIDARKVGGSTF